MANDLFSEKESGRIIDDKDTRFLMEQYHVLANDRIHHDQLFWNVPVTFLTAQSFLLVIALGGMQVHHWQSAIGAFISFVFGILSIQIFERNRILEITDAEMLLDMERHFLMKGFKGSEVHRPSSKRQYLDGNTIEQTLLSRNKLRFFNRGLSSDLWKRGMWLVTIVSLLLFLYNIFWYIRFEIFGFTSFRCFLKSLSATGLATVFILFAITWAVFLIESIKAIEEKVKKRRTLFRLVLISLESIAVIIATIHSWNVRYNKATLLKNMWLCVCAISIALIVIYICIFLCLNRRKKDLTSSNIMALVLAGGKSLRLQSIKDEIVKFLDITVSPEKTSLLNCTYDRNLSFTTSQTIITNDSCLWLIRLAFKNPKEINFMRVSHDFYEMSINKNDIREKKKIQTQKRYVFLEPNSKGTATAIFNFLWRFKQTFKDQANVDNDPVLVITPTDHIITDKNIYSQTISKVCELAKELRCIYLLGIIPNVESQMYGFIQVNNVASSVLKVERFIEKPESYQAKVLNNQGFVLWNSGIFIARHSVILNAFKEHWKYYCKFPAEYTEAMDMNLIYDSLAESSFDKDVLEQIDNLYAVRVSFDWIDVGDPVRLQSAMIEKKCQINVIDRSGVD